MSVVATPRRQPLHDRQPACPSHLPPTALALDLMSPSANRRRRHVASAVAGGQSACRSTTSSSQPQSGSSKRSREDDGDVAATAVTPKRCRLQRGAIATPTKAQSREAKILLPSPPLIHVDTAPSGNKDPRRKYTKEERIQREREITNFKEKYTKAFPNFRFYFHGIDASLRKELSSKVKSLGARVEDFFSGNVTHLISNRARPSTDGAEGLDPNKENIVQNSKSTGISKSGKTNSASLRSPIQLKSPRKGSLAVDPAPPTRNDPLILKAIQLSIKLWDSNKLDSMLGRLLTPPPKTDARKRLATTARPKSLQSLNAADRSNVTLSHLLQAEKQSGITTERDPKAKRHDYAYFPKNTHFLLIQDCDEAYAPVAVKDYGRWQKGDKPTWPVLNLDGVGYSNRSRAPVFGWRPEMDQAPARKAGLSTASRKPDLRKTVSLQGLNRKRTSISGENLLQPPPSFRRPDSTGNGSGSVAPSKYHSGASRPSFGSVSLASAASGLPSQGYVAASGNSAILTSNIASTTSTTGLLREADIMPGRKALHRQVVMNRTFGRQQAATTESKDNDTALLEAEPKTKDQAVVRPHVLRKSKSTNTMRLPPREETKKPGYCENCRVKFEDFSKHIKGNRHTRFANSSNNFLDLDETLARVRRKTLEEWQQENEFTLSDSSSDSESDLDEDADAIGEPSWDDTDDEVQAMVDYYRDSDPADDNDIDELALKREDVEMNYVGRRTNRERAEVDWDAVDGDEEDELSAF
ncbi:hypothetical protein FRB90_012875 [Tulasnella sp. 427]|nr:hypothetical protein FRB90_012875 [Tulasnella sp. 427]